MAVVTVAGGNLRTLFTAVGLLLGNTELEYLQTKFLNSFNVELDI